MMTNRTHQALHRQAFYITNVSYITKLFLVLCNTHISLDFRVDDVSKQFPRLGFLCDCTCGIN